MTCQFHTGTDRTDTLTCNWATCRKRWFTAVSHLFHIEQAPLSTFIGELYNDSETFEKLERLIVLDDEIEPIFCDLSLCATSMQKPVRPTLVVSQFINFDRNARMDRCHKASWPTDSSSFSNCSVVYLEISQANLRRASSRRNDGRSTLSVSSCRSENPVKMPSLQTIWIGAAGESK